MGWSIDNGILAKEAAEEALTQAERAELAGDYIDTKKPLIDKFTGEQTNLQTQINDLVLQDGTDVAEVVQARGGEVTLNERLNKTAAQLADTSRQTSVLSQGTSVVSASNNALTSVEIEGRTLINLLGRLGRTALATTVAVESAKFYVFVKHNQTTGVVTFTKYTGQTSLSLTWPSGEYAALYEVESANYAKIGLEWDSVAVGLRYPYVDDVKHLQGVGVIAEGENLLPPFTDGSWILHANSKVISPNEAELNATAIDQSLTITVPVVPNQTYTFSGLGRYYVSTRDMNQSSIAVYYPLNDGSVVLTTESNARFIRIQTRNITPGTFIFKNLMLNVGNITKPFVPRNPSTVFASIQLGAIGDKKDILYEDNGRWMLREIIKKSESLILGSNTATLVTNAAANTAIISSGDGTVFKRVTTLSGSGNEFTQSGTGNKTITFNASAIPASPVASYVLATVTNVDVTDKVEGSLKLNGFTQISVDSGYRRTVVDGKSTWIKGSKFDYSANPVAVKLTYANSIRNAVDDAVTKVQDNSTRLTVHEKAIVDLYVRVKALEVK